LVLGALLDDAARMLEHCSRMLLASFPHPSRNICRSSCSSPCQRTLAAARARRERSSDWLAYI
jgi:hypothetical protein